MSVSRIGAVFLCAAGVVLSPLPSFAYCVSSQMSSPNLGSHGSQLFGVAGRMPTDVWAVGAAPDVTAPTHGHTLAEHFDGSAWTIVPTPNDPTYPSDALYSVTSVSPSEAWAVGARSNASAQRSLVERWNGSTWTEVADADPSKASELLGVSSNPAKANAVWAVGYKTIYPGIAGSIPIAEFWNGQSWTYYKLQGQGVINSLASVSVTATGSAFAVGQSYDLVDFHPEIQRWNGANWRIVKSFAGAGELSGVAAISDDDVWAVGSYGGSGPALVEHFDGERWSIVPTPDVGGFAFLNSVRAFTHDDVWAVGNLQPRASIGVSVALVEHWNGIRWEVVPTPDSGWTVLDGVLAFPNQAIAVGGSIDFLFQAHYGTFVTTSHC